MVHTFSYLGLTVSSLLSLDAEVSSRIAKATSVMAKPKRRVWSENYLTKNTKLQAYQAWFLSTLIYIMGTLEDFSGCTEVASCPQSAVLLQMAVVLASLIQGLMNVGWRATQLMHKQLKKTNLRHPSKPWMYIY